MIHSVENALKVAIAARLIRSLENELRACGLQCVQWPYGCTEYADLVLRAVESGLKEATPRAHIEDAQAA